MTDKMQRRKPEILSPAGSIESVRAAVNAGCDAIYIGGSRFGARAYADNPQGDDMREVIRYCHRYGVRVYMTVNTLLKPEELEDSLYDYIAPYYLEGLDAAIVQDVGVMRFLHRHFPGLDLHASTQMTLTMGESAGVLEPYGVTRIVPARELSLPELADMRRETGLELEIFVYGALCYCYSGQCLFSSMLGGRSGNRGRCAQPCRQFYQCEDGRGAGYLLSPREHCSLGHIGELMEIGVDSLKLEGRMKRPEYVALTTAMYRKYVDLYDKLGRTDYEQYLECHESEWQEDMRRLAELYNRQGFTSGYMEGRSGVPYAAPKGKGDMIADLRPNHGGVQVGTVTAVDAHTATYRLERDVHAQDVVEFRDGKQRTSYEYTIGEGRRKGELVKARYLKGSRIRKGDGVYRTKDAGLLEEIRKHYLAEDAKIAVSMRFEAAEGQTMKLCAVFQGEGREISFLLEGDVCQKAQKSAAEEESIRRILCQTGGTAFTCSDCQVKLTGELFIPVGAVKRLRREVLAGLSEKLEASEYDRHIEKPSEHLTEESDGRLENAMFAQQRCTERTVVSVLYDWQAQMAIDAPGVDDIYLRTEQMDDSELRGLIRKGAASGKNMYLMMPLIFREAVYRLEQQKLSCGDSIYRMPELTGFVIRNMESFAFLTKEAGIAAERIITDANLYTANNEALSWWQDQGVKHCTVPLELTGQECQGLSTPVDMETVIYGYIPLMVSAQCVHRHQKGCQKKNGGGQLLWMKDAKKRAFVVLNCCKYCYNIIYHGDPLCLDEERQQYRKCGIKRFRYDFTIETPQEMTDILKGRFPKGQKGHFYDPVQ
ncbi:U32 family peptidase [Jutongia sp.]